MPIIEGFDFFPLRFDDHGALQSRQEFEALTARANTATDVVFIAHGFRNDENDATRLYTHFLGTFRANLSRPEFSTLANRQFVFAGVYWPSKPFRESYDEGKSGTRGLQDPSPTMADAKAQLEELKADDASSAQRRNLDKAIALLPSLEKSPQVQDEFVELVLSLVDTSSEDATEGLPQIRRRPGSEILARLSEPANGTRGIGDVAGKLAGGVGQFLNLTTWYVMKERSGTVGATGVADAVRTLRAKYPSLRLHVVGHSLGGRLAAACAKSLATAPKVPLDSLMLLEAAFSHFGFSSDNGRGAAGFFRDVVVQQVVKGPFVSTFSAQDTVVGKAYSVMSRLAGDNTREIGDARDEFGGIGRNGPLRTSEVATTRLNNAGTSYDFKDRVINNLDGSGGLIKDHGDVTNEAITYAFASAIART
jgi:Lipase (class 3)